MTRHSPEPGIRPQYQPTRISFGRLLTKSPISGSHRNGLRLGRHCIRRLTAWRGLEAIHKHPQRSIRLSCLPRRDRPNPRPVCRAVIRAPVRDGFPGLIAMMDWATARYRAGRSRGAHVRSLDNIRIGAAPEVICPKGTQGRRVQARMPVRDWFPPHHQTAADGACRACPEQAEAV